MDRKKTFAILPKGEEFQQFFHRWTWNGIGPTFANLRDIRKVGHNCKVGRLPRVGPADIILDVDGSEISS